MEMNMTDATSDDIGRRTLLMGALTIGSAGVAKPEQRGVGHLLAMNPTVAELESLRDYEATSTAETRRRRQEGMKVYTEHGDEGDVYLATSDMERRATIDRAIEILGEVGALKW